ncbi:hypothetical protein BH10BAC5_BH10BAC5_27000 [soil metagenome]
MIKFSSRYNYSVGHSGELFAYSSPRMEILTDLAKDSITYQNIFTDLKLKALSCEILDYAVPLSARHQLVTAPSYLELISLGEKAVPFLLQKLDHFPMVWIPALEIIAGVNPVSEENYGDVEETTKDWNDWGLKNKYL